MDDDDDDFMDGDEIDRDLLITSALRIEAIRHIMQVIGREMKLKPETVIAAHRLNEGEMTKHQSDVIAFIHEFLADPDS